MDEICAGNEDAFEVAYDRYQGGLLSMCRRMLGSSDEAEEALQQSLTRAWYFLRRDDRPRPDHLRPWLYAVAKNRCLSIISARGPATVELEDSMVAGTLSEHVERRAELTALLADVRQLPEEQRQALVLSEVVGLSHAQIAEMLGRREAAIKSIVFHARQTLADWREARELPCAEVRQQLSTLRGGSLRRKPLRRHLELCDGCRSYRAEVGARRGAMAVLLLPFRGLWLKGAAGAAGSSSAGAAGGSSVGGAVGATLAGLAPAAATVSVASVIAVGGFAGTAVILGGHRSKVAGSPSSSQHATGASAIAPAAAVLGRAPRTGPSATHSKPTTRPRGLSPRSARTAGTRGSAVHLSTTSRVGSSRRGQQTTAAAPPTTSSPAAASSSASATSANGSANAFGTTKASKAPPLPKPQQTVKTPPLPPSLFKPQPTVKTSPPPPPPKPPQTVKTPPPLPQQTVTTPPLPPPPKPQPTAGHGTGFAVAP